jgi:hypothetical protein
MVPLFLRVLQFWFGFIVYTVSTKNAATDRLEIRFDEPTRNVVQLHDVSEFVILFQFRLRTRAIHENTAVRQKE